MAYPVTPNSAAAASSAFHESRPPQYASGVVRYDHTAETENELSVAEGEVVLIIEEDLGKEWLAAGGERA